MKEFRVVGKPVERLGARDKAIGTALYAGDLALPGTLYAKILRSPHPKARILSLDKSAAEAMPGVVAVMCADDVPDKRFGLLHSDEPIFAAGEVRYVGERVAAVAAEDAYTANAALKLIKVEYEVLDPVFDMEEALKPGAPLVHPEGAEFGPGFFFPTSLQPEGNVSFRDEIVDGDVEQGFRDADVIVEERYETAAAHQASIEPHVCVARFELDALTVWTSTQAPFNVQWSVAAALDIPMGSVRVVTMETGGGFGGKVSVMIEPVAAALAKRCRRPVQLTYTRQEELEDTRPRAQTITELKTGAKSDGTLLARQLRFLLDNGAYTDFGPGTVGGALAAARGPYRLPNVKFEGLAIYTNKFNTGAFRAPGFVQLTFALESHLDSLAARLGMSPVELRRKNALRAGDATFAGTKLKSDVLLHGLDLAANAIAEAGPPAPNTGWGVACGEWKTGGHPGGAYLTVKLDGTVTLVSGATDLSGSRTSLAQIVAEELALDISQVNAVTGDTLSVPLAPLSGGSMVTYNMANLLKKLCHRLREKLLDRASAALGVDMDALEIEGGSVRVREAPDKSISFAALGGSEPLTADSSQDTLAPTHAFAINAVKVSVDPDTGELRILRAIGIQDCGTAVNPQSVEGQITGGMVQALGQAVSEEIIFDHGRVANRGLADYRLLTAADLPSIETHLLEEEPGPDQALGVKGIGEPVHIPGVAAVANAVFAATGKRVRRTPLTPERVLRAAKEVAGD